ncbi:uncharacterized protein [Musca autumnalis]|uniref:uncharacterized protein n=1 Tax=Musca autumnalis TaxID=221902 RepID=UPI003CE7F32E
MYGITFLYIECVLLVTGAVACIPRVRGGCCCSHHFPNGTLPTTKPATLSSLVDKRNLLKLAHCGIVGRFVI